MIPTTTQTEIDRRALPHGRALALVRISSCHRWAPPRWMLYLHDEDGITEIGQAWPPFARLLLIMVAKTVTP